VVGNKIPVGIIITQVVREELNVSLAMLPMDRVFEIDCECLNFPFNPLSYRTLLCSGKTVCIFYLVDSCKFGGKKCNYSHSRGAPPRSGWWNSGVETYIKAEYLNKLGRVGAFKMKAVDEERKVTGKV